MKRKKMAALFKAIEDISKRNPKDVYVQESDMQYDFGNGQKSPRIKVLPTRGKYMLPEVKIIKDIVTSIEPVDLPKEVISINREAGFPVMVLMKSTNSSMMVLNVNTVYGSISFMAYVNPDTEVPEAPEDETAPITEDELKVLRQFAAANA